MRAAVRNLPSPEAGPGTIRFGNPFGVPVPARETFGTEAEREEKNGFGNACAHDVTADSRSSMRKIFSDFFFGPRSLDGNFFSLCFFSKKCIMKFVEGKTSTNKKKSPRRRRRNTKSASTETRKEVNHMATKKTTKKKVAAKKPMKKAVKKVAKKK